MVNVFKKLTELTETNRSSRWNMFFRIGALKNFTMLTKKKTVLELYFNKVAHMKLFKKTFFV